MFTDKQKEAYGAVKAPDELREQIFSSVENDKNTEKKIFKTQFSRIVAAAACVALVAFAVFAAFSGNGIEVSVNGSFVAENASVALTDVRVSPLARNVTQAEVTLTLDIDSDALITVDSGSFDVKGEGENLTEFSAEDSVEIIWRSNGTEKSEMTVDYGRKTCVLILEYNGEWIVTRK